MDVDEAAAKVAAVTAAERLVAGVASTCAGPARIDHAPFARCADTNHW